MRHLFPCRVEILRLSGTMKDGVPLLSYNKLDTIVDTRLGLAGEMMCRLDLNFLRPGKDQPAPASTGRAPDRIGVLFFTYDAQIRANDRIRCIDGPVEGTFEIRNTPDPAVGFARRHHCEVQIIEVAQSVNTGLNAGVPIVRNP